MTDDTKDAGNVVQFRLPEAQPQAHSVEAFIKELQARAAADQLRGVLAIVFLKNDPEHACGLRRTRGINDPDTAYAISILQHAMMVRIDSHYEPVA